MTARTLAACAALLLGLLVRPCTAQSPGQNYQMFLDPDAGGRVFYVNCSGTAGDKTRFANVGAQVLVSFNPPDMPNPIQVVIDARPALGAKNSFYWNSNHTALDFGGQSLRSTLKPLFTKQSDICFFYMSPALYRSRQALTHNDAERIRWVDTYARPIRIIATQGELTLTVRGNSVTGHLWMVGYDQMDNRPVRYVADFEGQEYVSEKAKH